MVTNYSEDQFKHDFTLEGLKLLIDYHLKTKETEWLDFKSVPTTKLKSFWYDIRRDIQCFANTDGGVIILGVNQDAKDPDKRIEGVIGTDDACNTLSQAKRSFGIDLLFPVMNIEGKNLIFILIPRAEGLIYYEGKVRIRVGTTRADIESDMEQKKWRECLQTKQSGHVIIGKMRESIDSILYWNVRDGTATKHQFQKFIAIKLEETNITLSLVLFIYSRLRKLYTEDYILLNERKLKALGDYVSKALQGSVIFHAIFGMICMIIAFLQFPVDFRIALQIFSFILIIEGLVIVLVMPYFHTKRKRKIELLNLAIEQFHSRLPIIYPELETIEQEIVVKKDLDQAASIILSHILIFYIYI
ncbi:MAG: helix-turn-helix domain-containing protein, partial [Candidatus Odinarchaeota archaeon]